MKHLKYTRLFGWFAAAAALLLTTSCKDEIFGLGSDEEEVTVQFTLNPEAATFASRADGDVDGSEGSVNTKYTEYPKTPETKISRGTLANMLIYAVYDENGKLIEEYGKGVLGENAKEKGVTAGTGQTILDAKFSYNKDENGNVHKEGAIVSLKLRRGTKYTIAFWAQNNETNAYSTTDLRKVEMVYTDTAKDDSDDTTSKSSTVNNDERRDAFCRSVTITAGVDGMEQDVYLYRPLAQINVGTSGYDYETAIRSTENKYRYSRIRINRAARYLNVVTDRIYTNTTDPEDETLVTLEAHAVVDYDYAPMPAFIRIENNEFTNVIPNLPTYTVWDYYYADKGEMKFPSDPDIYNDEDARKMREQEEFLKVHLYDDEQKKAIEYTDEKNPNYTFDKDGDGYLDYARMADDGKKSEVFKYLSMSYVLVSSNDNQSTMLNNVTVWLDVDGDRNKEIQLLNLDNVPVQRNWRTNIVGDLLTTQNTVQVVLDRDFAGEYNGRYDNGIEEWSGMLADGVYYYYDEETGADEIQISNANGLIWFQKMVNGTMKIRDLYFKDAWYQYGKKYYYYFHVNNNGSKVLKQFPYDGIPEPKDEKLKARILKATHQDQRTGKNWDGTNANGWPTNGNFHFTGATVKLMADINLDGIEWIPIGLDGKIWEQVNYKFDDEFDLNRGFYGTFDGNNHTVYNITTKRFNAQVPLFDVEKGISGTGKTRDQYAPNYNETGYDYQRHIDNFQWFSRGFFGEIGGNATIKNLRLQNVDYYGCHGVGGVVGIAYGDRITIDNCIVDGGTIIATPMYRGDSRDTSDNLKNRTYARGVYLGGIVGYFNTTNGSVTNCEVRNLTIRGYRRVGGLIGSVDLAYTEDSDAKTEGSQSHPYAIRNNHLSNVVILGSQYSTFSLYTRYNAEKTSNVDTNVDYINGEPVNRLRTGFNWGSNSYNLFQQMFVGGDSKDFVDKADQINSNGEAPCQNNTASGVKMGSMTVEINLKEGYGDRYSEISNTPLEYMPMLSSWFADSIMILNNYDGTPSAHVKYNVYTVPVKESMYTLGYSTNDNNKNEFANKNAEFRYPMELPAKTEVHWDETSPVAGIFVESVGLSGKNGPNGRSVITPNGVNGDGACALFVTARDIKQVYDIFTDNIKSKIDNNTYKGSGYKQRTYIENVVVRGEPYADTGILLSPNDQMSSITLQNVAVYDAYRTIALNNTKGTKGKQWPEQVDPSGIDLNIFDCNLRGYTVPGDGWKKVTYKETTFEAGSNTGGNRNERTTLERTCKVDAPSNGSTEVTFNKCYFKAPYRIDLRNADLTKVTFVGCSATSTTLKNLEISSELIPEGCTRISITTKTNGDPVITYYKGLGTEESKWEVITK